MKRIIKILIMSLVMLFPLKVMAIGNITVSPSSLTVEVGSKKTFTIEANNTIGDVSIMSNNTGIAKVSAKEWGTGMIDEKTTKKGTITVTGVSEGSTTITLKIDAATFDGQDLSGQTRTINVKVVPKTTSSNPPTPTPTPVTTSKSTNNKIKDLSVVGHSLTKVNNSNYTVTVPNDVTSVVVNVTPEDSKAKVTGTGTHNLNIGSNKISIVVTAESGDQNTILLDVTRKDMASINDLNELLKDSKNNSINLSINNVTKISANNLNSIKDSGKTVYLNYYDDSKNVIYSWVIDAHKLTYVSDFNPVLTFSSNNELEINEDANYANGLILDFANNGDIPKDIIVKVNVKEKFIEGNVLKLYSYKDHEFALASENIQVVNGYVELPLEHTSTYYLTQSKLNMECVNVNNVVNNNQFPIIIILASALGLLGLFNIWYFFIRKPKQYMGY